MLLASYTPGQATHKYLSDVLAAGAEAAGTGYVAGGQTLTGVTLTQSGTVETLTCNSPSWANSTITAAFAVFYDDSPATQGAKPVLAYWDFGGSRSSSGTAFTLTVNAAGLITFTAS
jgi:hypothetical protein